MLGKECSNNSGGAGNCLKSGADLWHPHDCPDCKCVQSVKRAESDFKVTAIWNDRLKPEYLKEIDTKFLPDYSEETEDGLMAYENEQYAIRGIVSSELNASLESVFEGMQDDERK